MNYEILSLETKAIKMLEYYTRYGENITLNGNALKPILAVLRGEE